MEIEGVKRLFRRSEEDHGLRYTTYVGDGDSRSFTIITKLQPYGPEVEIKKEECVGHIQKRMGTRLRSLITKAKGTFCTLLISYHSFINKFILHLFIEIDILLF